MIVLYSFSTLNIIDPNSRKTIQCYAIVLVGDRPHNQDVSILITGTT